MTKKWIVLANKCAVKVFSCKGRGNGLALVHDVSFPEGRLKNKDVTTDRAGRKGFRSGPMVPEQNVKEHFEDTFAHKVSELLEHGRSKNEYEELILVAEPHFLGKLRSVLKQPTAALVTESHHKDLLKLSEKSVEEHVRSLLFPS